jgi:hypothetical protein
VPNVRLRGVGGASTEVAAEVPDCVRE